MSDTEKPLAHVDSKSQPGELATGGQAPASAHSPLPWRVDVSKSWQVTAMSGAYYVATCHLSPGDLDDNGVEIYSAEANAEFIVRCVNSHDALVAALRAAFQFVQPEVPRGPASNGWANTVALIHEALAQAEGK